MGRIERFPSIAPAPAVMRILGRFNRPTLEAFLSVAIDLLDTLDGDPDAEEADPAGQCDEDGINTDIAVMRYTNGAGCEIGDPGGDEHDGREPDHDEELEQIPDDPGPIRNVNAGL